MPVSVTTGVAGTPITVPGLPYAVYVVPDGRTAYVEMNGGGTISLVDLVTGALGDVITVPKGAGELAFNRAGSMAYANGNSADAIGNQQFSYVTPINLVTDVAEAPIAILHDLFGIALSPDGRTTYVTGGT